VKFLHLVWRNALRNKRRAVLTVVSISVAIVAISVLNSVLHSFSAAVEIADEARMVVRNQVSLIFPLPLAYRQRIAAMPGIKGVAAANWFGGVYRERKNFFAKFAVDAESYFPIYPEFGVKPKEFKAFMDDRKGCIVGRKIANLHDFKVGQTIPILGDIFPGDWEFNVRGIYDGLKPGTDETTMFFHWKYLDESMPVRRQGQVGFYIVQLEEPSMAASLVKTIDSEFENSADQTLTETEKAFQQGFVKMMGNIELLVRTIGSAVVFTLLLVAANTMAMAARERTTEIAIMKTLGFSGLGVAALLVAESVLLMFAGWAAGTAVSWLMCRAIETGFSAIFPVFPLKPETMALSFAVAIVTGVISGLFPAFHAIRTTIVGAMRQVA